MLMNVTEIAISPVKTLRVTAGVGVGTTDEILLCWQTAGFGCRFFHVRVEKRQGSPILQLYGRNLRRRGENGGRQSYRHASDPCVEPGNPGARHVRRSADSSLSPGNCRHGPVRVGSQTVQHVLAVLPPQGNVLCHRQVLLLHDARGRHAEHADMRPAGA